VIKDPDLVLFLPLSRRLVDILSDYTDTPKSRIPALVLRAAKLLIISPEVAILELFRACSISEHDLEAKARVKVCFLEWRDRIPIDRQVAMAQTLWALNQLLSMISYRDHSDIQFPSFSAIHAYPLGRVVNLVSPAVLVDPLSRILELDLRPQVLQYAAYCLGILPLRSSAKPWERTRELHSALRQRKTQIGKRWRLADRQLLYCQAQQGGEQAHAEFLSKLGDPEVGRFEAEYNTAYYGGDHNLIRDRFERRLDEGVRTDDNVRAILLQIYDYIRNQKVG
jgi:hypothetical protein